MRGGERVSQEGNGRRRRRSSPISLDAFRFQWLIAEPGSAMVVAPTCRFAWASVDHPGMAPPLDLRSAVAPTTGLVEVAATARGDPNPSEASRRSPWFIFLERGVSRVNADAVFSFGSPPACTSAASPRPSPLLHPRPVAAAWAVSGLSISA